VTTRRIILSISLVIIAAAVQTTLFVDFRPFDVAPAVVVLTVVAVSRHLPGEAAVAIGFGIGVLLDLLSESPLGLWALVMTTLAFTTVRLRDRSEDDPVLLGIGVFALSLGALALFAILGTIFGEKTLADSGIVRKIVLPSLYTTLLALVVLPVTTWLLVGGRVRSGWEL
jgi:rod shape-determining protein MreD